MSLLVRHIRRGLQEAARSVTDCGFVCSRGGDAAPQHSHTGTNTRGFGSSVWAIFCNMGGGGNLCSKNDPSHRKCWGLRQYVCLTPLCTYSRCFTACICSGEKTNLQMHSTGFSKLESCLKMQKGICGLTEPGPEQNWWWWPESDAEAGAAHSPRHTLLSSARPCLLRCCCI